MKNDLQNINAKVSMIKPYVYIHLKTQSQRII